VTGCLKKLSNEKGSRFSVHGRQFEVSCPTGRRGSFLPLSLPAGGGQAGKFEVGSGFSVLSYFSVHSIQRAFSIDPLPLGTAPVAGCQKLAILPASSNTIKILNNSFF
jgi:hypothetical protein